jgi:Ni,Fe-hydrogenase III small subunit
MKNKILNLKVFSFSHPLMNTEWLSILGDKYSQALPFRLEMVPHPDLAEVIVWDGVTTLKNQQVVGSFLKRIGPDKVLLLLGESVTLLKQNSLVKIIDPQDVQYVEVSGWSILPEEILSALEICYQKLNHV